MLVLVLVAVPLLSLLYIQSLRISAAYTLDTNMPISVSMHQCHLHLHFDTSPSSADDSLRVSFYGNSGSSVSMGRENNAVRVSNGGTADAVICRNTPLGSCNPCNATLTLPSSSLGLPSINLTFSGSAGFSQLSSTHALQMQDARLTVEGRFLDVQLAGLSGVPSVRVTRGNIVLGTLDLPDDASGAQLSTGEGDVVIYTSFANLTVNYTSSYVCVDAPVLSTTSHAPHPTAHRPIRPRPRNVATASCR
jgi:hypothetical protein